jgi:septal ring factor EnvC (AmiA/AmiB activator)
LLAAAIPGAAASDSAENLAKIKSEISNAKAQDAGLARRIKEGERAAAQTKRALVKTADELSRLEAEQAAIADKIAHLNNRRAALESEIEEKKGGLMDAAAGLTAISYAGAASGFDSAAIRDHIITGAILSAVSNRFDAEMKAADLRRKELSDLTGELKKKHGDFAATEKDRRREKAELSDLLHARANQNHELKGRQYELQARLSDLSARAKSLSDLADKIGQAPAAAAKRSGRMRLPVSGMLVRRFADLSAEGSRSDGWRIRTGPGALVQSPGGGRVEFADTFRSYGKTAIINHGGGYHTVLAKMDSLSVLIGQDVLPGEPIGLMGNSNPEIYLVLRKNDRAIDPAKMFPEPR